ncbi:transcription elongation protein SprT [Litoribacter alkaliphilus]|uniref:Transcription elongation protein SprT n=1 Tax=Litoribacter ruber TaxID=702568 RepID=A0AAP2G0I5_9BACT|nr:SprT-like domain-containing protein [Litoribacter alkaliphilus]MBS9522412.1 transcription elongation protein SprT [Litoribacter alkaliphilus]
MEMEKKIYQAFVDHVPGDAAGYCFDLWKEDPFRFVISRSRSSKLGDFRYRRDRDVQTITINYDLNPYQFLITYIHEVAHHRVYRDFGLGVRPHGPEWKMVFRKLLAPMLSDLVFPKDILIPLKRHMLNPKASSGADVFLSRELKKYDLSFQEGLNRPLFLTDIKVGQSFSLRGRVFTKEDTRRTRVVCLEVASGRKYLISLNAEVEAV